MSAPPIVPPIKCQGIKTKLVNDIVGLAGDVSNGRWIEPFCGSCVVAFNVQPKRALLCDTNIHIVQFYKDIQTEVLSPENVRGYLEAHGEQLRTIGEAYFYEVRDRFNANPNSFDFLFLNRSCFNGVMRFNRSGKFNVPFCHKANRFSPAYISKIVNQVRTVGKIIKFSDWEFKVANFKETLNLAQIGDIIYADPPYAGRHVDYFNSWSDEDESNLAEQLSNLESRFILSTWHSNEFRSNPHIAANWSSEAFHILTRAHYYHVGATEELRHPMLEALITNFSHHYSLELSNLKQQSLFAEL